MRALWRLPGAAGAGASGRATTICWAASAPLFRSACRARRPSSPRRPPSAAFRYAERARGVGPRRLCVAARSASACRPGRLSAPRQPARHALALAATPAVRSSPVCSLCDRQRPLTRCSLLLPLKTEYGECEGPPFEPGKKLEKQYSPRGQAVRWVWDEGRGVRFCSGAVGVGPCACSLGLTGLAWDWHGRELQPARPA